MGFLFAKRHRRRKSSFIKPPKISKFWMIVVLGLVLYFFGVKQGWWQKFDIAFNQGAVKGTFQEKKASETSGQSPQANQNQPTNESPPSPSPKDISGFVLMDSDGNLFIQNIDNSRLKVPRDKQNYKEFSNVCTESFVLSILGDSNQSGGDLIEFNLADGHYEILNRQYPNSLAPALSPDCQSMAYVARKNQEFVLYVSGLDGRAQKEIAHFDQPIFLPQFSADSQFVAYSVVQSGKSKLTIVNVAAGDKIELETKGQIIASAPVNQDSALTIAAKQSGVGLSADIYLLNPNGNDQLTNDGGEKRNLFLSPDAKFAYFIKKPNGLIKLNLETKETSKITEAEQLLGLK